MSLTKLDVYNVRNIISASLAPSPTLNFIYGLNASGKSSLLEAIYILGRLKSFRSNNLKQAICFAADQFTIAGQINSDSTRPIKLGVQLNSKSLITHFNQEPNHVRSEFAYALPLQLIHPKSYKLLDAGPQLRREYIDWGIFNNDKDYLMHWRKFKKALSQRNVLLKQRLPQQVSVWDHELVKYGTIVTEYRRLYLEHLKPFFFDVSHQFLNFKQLEIQYYQGWDNTQDFQTALNSSFAKDSKYGYTTCGPHHSDLKVLVNGKTAKDYVSRGQLKLLVLALKLAQIAFLQNQQNTLACILIDDLASELDKHNKLKLMNFLADTQMQVFMTATDLNDFDDISHFSQRAMFHVEQGRIDQM